MKQKKAEVGHMTDAKRRAEAKMMAHFKAHGVPGRAQHLAAMPTMDADGDYDNGAPEPAGEKGE